MSNHRIDDRGRYKEIELSQPSSRPRSRSPVRNGRLDLSKADHDRRHDDKVGSSSGVKVKEERREEELLQAEREKLIQNSYLGLTGHSIPSHSVPPPLSLSLLDRSRMIPPHPYMAALDPRSTAPSSTVWNPFDKASEFNHRMEMERERDRERMVMFSRLTNAPMTPITLMEQERFKEHMLREQHEREYRQYIERERLSYEQKLRAMDSLAAAATFNPFTQTLSPMFNHLPPSNKGGSPAGLVPGIPPPLIPSMSATIGHPSATSSRSHNNSPSSSKSKGYSLADSTSDMKDKRDSCSTDPDAHSR